MPLTHDDPLPQPEVRQEEPEVYIITLATPSDSTFSLRYEVTLLREDLDAIGQTLRAVVEAARKC